ncbi:MAG TPA: hypothetical protein VF250_08865 [Conexibacter sp.]
MAVGLITRYVVAIAIAVVVGAPASAIAVSGVTFTPGEALTQTGRLRVSGPSLETVVDCPITLSGSLATGLTAITSNETVIGTISGLSAGRCTTGSITTVLGLPASLRLNMSRETPAGSVSLLILRSPTLGVRVRLSSGGECLASGFEAIMERPTPLGNNEYTLVRSFDIMRSCSGFYSWWIELAAPTPRQVATFLTGNEVINGFTPTPVVFGTVGPGDLRQITVTIGSTAGGRIEEIVVTSQRYFAITDPNGCRGRTLEARGTCNINAILSAPTEAGRSVEDTLTVKIAERRFEGALRAST